MATENLGQRVVDSISSYFNQGCSVPSEMDVGKFTAAIYAKKCGEDDGCFTLIGCAINIELPPFEREMIVIDDTTMCSALNGDDDWERIVPDSRKRMSEMSLDLYYTSSRYRFLIDMFSSSLPYIFVIETSDNVRTQLSFLGYLESVAPTFPAGSESEVAMIPVTFRPTGKPHHTTGVDIPVCRGGELEV